MSCNSVCLRRSGYCQSVQSDSTSSGFLHLASNIAEDMSSSRAIERADSLNAKTTFLSLSRLDHTTAGSGRKD